eukprot:jgi/Undpi1/5515/HiC_scaffold_2.g00794.m1
MRITPQPETPSSCSQTPTVSEEASGVLAPCPGCRLAGVREDEVIGNAEEREWDIFARQGGGDAEVEALVGKRKRFFGYLKKTHEEGGFWLNCVQLTRQGDLAIYAAELSSQRILRLFYLGVGLAKLLQCKGGAQLIRGILQLMEEWEYHFALAGVAHHSVKAMLAKNIDGPSRDAMREMGGEGTKQQEQVVARLLKFNNEVVYEQLLTPEVPFALDYLEVVFSLCEVMCRVYAKFVEEECYKNGFVYDGLVKVDNKIKHHIINVFAKELTDMSTTIAKAELKTLR